VLSHGIEPPLALCRKHANPLPPDWSFDTPGLHVIQKNVSLMAIEIGNRAQEQRLTDPGGPRQADAFAGPNRKLERAPVDEAQRFDV
jgi:hypothetical protein